MPYPYTLMPDSHTLEPEEDEQAEESQSWLPSYIPPIVPPTPRPGLTSGESGGDGTSPPPLDVDPAVQEYERNLYQRLGITPPHESGEPTTGQSNPRPGADSSQAGDALGAGHGKDESGAQEVLPDFEEAEENRIDPADIKFYLAARHNPVLKELRLICQQEKIPSPWKDRSDLLLWLCAEYGIDEENDAEAEAFLAHWTQELLGSDVRKHSTYNPTLKANELWAQAHAAFDPQAEDAAIEVKNYRAHLETTYGVTFTRAVKGKPTEAATSWDLDLLGLTSAHKAFEMQAIGLGEWARGSGFYWDDATAFREIMGTIQIYNSLESPPTITLPDGTKIAGASAKVVGQTVHVFWKAGEKRNFHVYTNVMLHELGHIYNANVGLGNPYSPISINETSGHPMTRKGMGSPDPDVLLGKIPAFTSSSTRLPKYHEILGVSPDDKIFAHVPETVPTQVVSLHQSTDPSPNEVTADAILNWSYHQTSDVFGFTHDPDGLAWQAFMSGGVDKWNSACDHLQYTQEWRRHPANKG